MCKIKWTVKSKLYNGKKFIANVENVFQCKKLETMRQSKKLAKVVAVGMEIHFNPPCFKYRIIVDLRTLHLAGKNDKITYNPPCEYNECSIQ